MYSLRSVCTHFWSLFGHQDASLKIIAESHSNYRYLTKKHKTLLQEYRESIKSRLNQLEPIEKVLSFRDIFSKTNIDLLEDFSGDVFKISEESSNGFVEISRQIIGSSVEVIQKNYLDERLGF